jgi:hypothetical protein
MPLIYALVQKNLNRKRASMLPEYEEEAERLLEEKLGSTPGIGEVEIDKEKVAAHV